MRPNRARRLVYLEKGYAAADRMQGWQAATV